MFSKLVRYMAMKSLFSADSVGVECHCRIPREYLRGISSTKRTAVAYYGGIISQSAHFHGHAGVAD